jgi:hypothetical protein
MKTGIVPIATVMRRLLTGYAVTFNRRHRRTGHLFQNRYKSILCQEDPYLLELVRYIHLNPLRTGLVSSMKELNVYRYCGHSFLLGKRNNHWQDTDTVLQLFGKRVSPARKNYLAFVERGLDMGRRSDLTGGGLIRSTGGWKELKAFRRLGIHIKGDERILGDSDFVESILEEHNERLEQRYLLQMQGYDVDKVAERVAKLFELKPEEVLTSSKKPKRVRARSLLCYWAVKELEIGGADIARRLKISQSAVSRAVARGEMIAAEMDVNLMEK